MYIRTKAKKGLVFMFSLMMLVMMTSTVWAAGIGGSKDTDPVVPNKYVVGDEIKYKMEVLNPSDYDITVDVFEDYPDGTRELIDSQLTLAPGGSKSYTSYYVVKASDADPTNNEIENFLRVQGFDSTGDEVSGNYSAVSTIVFPSISVDIDASAYVLPGETVTYHYTIKNTGDTDLTVQSIVDSLFGNIADKYPSTLSPGQKETVTFTKSLDSTDLSISNNVQVIYEVEGTTYAHTVEDSDEHVVTINNRPVAVDLNERTPEDTPLTINVVDKASDPDQDVLTVSEVTQGANGAVVINDDGTVTYTPNPDYNGTDTFTYTISDGKGGTDTATVTVIVEPVNDNPIAVDDNAKTSEGVPTNIDVLANDSDPDNDVRTVTEVTDGENGKVTINADGTVKYTPNTDFVGTDSFTYTISDGNGGTATASVTVIVYPKPIARDDQVETAEDTPVTIDVLANDGQEGDQLTVVSVSNPLRGTVKINEDGTVTYTPNLNVNGTDSFTYTIKDDNGGTATATVSVTINPVNDAPIAVNDSADTKTGTAVKIDVLANDSDPENDALSVLEVTQGKDGTVVINEDGTVTYTPNAGFIGKDTFTYVVMDEHEAIATGTVTVNVNPRSSGGGGSYNYPPKAVDDEATTHVNQPVNVPVLNNDSDPEKGTLKVITVTQGVYGSVTINSDGTVRYVPQADYIGTDSFKYTVADNGGNTATATVQLIIKAADDVDSGSESPEGGVIELPGVANPQPGNGDLPVDGVKVPNGVTDGPLTVKVWPTRVPAGDPTISVNTGKDIQSVYAILPDGTKLTLKQKQPGFWQVSFFVPFGTPDGPYDIKVYTVDALGNQRSSNYQIEIDNSIPIMKINQTVLDNNQYQLTTNPLFNVQSIYCIDEAGNKINFSKNKKNGLWSAIVPAGKISITGVDHSGTLIKQEITLAPLASGAIAKLEFDQPDLGSTVSSKHSVMAPEVNNTENAVQFSYLLAALALILVGAFGAMGKRTFFIK